MQNKLSDFAPSIIPDTDRIYLESVEVLTPETSLPIEYSGYFNFSLLVFTPYLGTVEVDAENLVIENTGDILGTDKSHLTEFQSGFNYDRKLHAQPVNSGLNKVNFNMPLKIFAFTNFNKLNVEQESYAIGDLKFRATLYNTEEAVVKEQTFSQIVYLTIRTQS